MKAGVVGASGFTGGELCRLIDGHPEFNLAQATSREYANRTVGHVHPNLRHLDVRFSEPDDLESVDVLFAATPHGVSMANIDAFRDAEEFKQELQEMAEDIRAEPRKDPDTPIYVPGDPEKERKADRIENGIPLPDHTRERFADVAAEFDVEPIVEGDT